MRVFMVLYMPTEIILELLSLKHSTILGKLSIHFLLYVVPRPVLDVDPSKGFTMTWTVFTTDF